VSVRQTIQQIGKGRREHFRIAVVLLALLGYSFMYRVLIDLVGNDVIPAFLSLVPVMLAGWYWGPRVGMATGVLVVPINWILFTMMEGGSVLDFLLKPLVIPGSAALVVLGAITGMLRRSWTQFETASAQSEEADALLATMERRSQSFLDRMPIGVFRVEPNGRLLYGNAALANIFGHAQVEHLVEVMTTGSHPSAEAFRRLLAAVEIRGAVLGQEVELKSYQGNPIWVRVSARGLDDPGGTLVQIEGTLEDITKSRLAEAALQTSEARHGQLFRDSPVPILEEDWSEVGAWLSQLRTHGINDLESYLTEHSNEVSKAVAKVRIANANTAALQFFGASDLADLQTHLSSAGAVREDVESNIEILLSMWEGKLRFTVEQRTPNVLGETREAVVSWLAGGTETDPDLRRVLIALSDVTERKATERAVQSLLDDLNQRLRIERALSEASAILLQSDPSTAIDEAIGVLLTATDAEYVFVEQNYVDEELGPCTRVIHEVAETGLEHNIMDPYWNERPWSTMPASYEALSRGNPFYFASQKELPPIERETYQRDESSSDSELDLPIFIGDEWVGLVGFADGASRHWDEGDINLLRTAADLIGGFWFRQRALERLEQTVDEREAAFGFERAIAACSRTLLKGDTDEAIDSALETIIATTGSTHAFVSINNDDAESGLGYRTLQWVSRVGIDPRVDRAHWQQGTWSVLPATGAALSKGLPFSFSHIAELDPVDRAMVEGADQPIRAGSIVPIMREGRWIGSLGLHDSEKSRDWQAAEIRLMQAAADMIATVWDRRSTQDRLQKLLRSKDDFVASVSHELRTPLSVVMGLSTELEHSIDQFHPNEITEFVAMIAEQSRELSQMVEDLLVVARAEVALLSVLPKTIDVREEVSSLLSDLAPTLGNRVVFREGEATGWADPLRLRQVLRNLLINAARYGGDRVEVGIEERGSMVAIVVSDNGPGIPLADRDRIFDAYESAHLTPGRPSSLGLGLTVSRQLTRVMGGNLTYRYEDRSVFEVTIPRTPTRNPFLAPDYASLA
jgi:PAS domain S-box-containing protein